MLESIKNNRQLKDIPYFDRKERKSLKKAYKQELVKRNAINKIIASWLITVPVSAVLGGVTYYVITSLGFSI